MLQHMDMCAVDHRSVGAVWSASGETKQVSRTWWLRPRAMAEEEMITLDR